MIRKNPMSVHVQWRHNFFLIFLFSVVWTHRYRIYGHGRLAIQFHLNTKVSSPPRALHTLPAATVTVPKVSLAPGCPCFHAFSIPSLPLPQTFSTPHLAGQFLKCTLDHTLSCPKPHCAWNKTFMALWLLTWLQLPFQPLSPCPPPLTVHFIWVLLVPPCTTSFPPGLARLPPFA